MSIRNDLIRIGHNPDTIAEYWCRIPVKIVRGGLWIGLIRPYEHIPKDAKICESKLYKRDMPRTFPSVDRNTMMRKEVSVF